MTLRTISKKDENEEANAQDGLQFPSKIYQRTRHNESNIASVVSCHKNIQ